MEDYDIFSGGAGHLLFSYYHLCVAKAIYQARAAGMSRVHFLQPDSLDRTSVLSRQASNIGPLLPLPQLIHKMKLPPWKRSRRVSRDVTLERSRPLSSPPFAEW